MFSKKFAVGFFFLFKLNILCIMGETCPFPRQLKDNYDYDWTSRSDEWSNTESHTDYFVLSLSWSPSYCASISDETREEKFQCDRKNGFGLIAHGLWPQTSGSQPVKGHPRNCRNEEQLPQSIIHRYFCLMPDEVLMQSEWEKHGSCYFRTATDYFNTIESLYNRLNIPDIRSMGDTTFLTIKNAFFKLNSPQLFATAFYVNTRRNGQLREIRFCYDLQYNFISCKQ